MMRLLFATLIFIQLNACSAITSLTTATPQQAATVAEATQLLTVAEKGADLYVTTGNPSPAVVGQLRILVPAVHNTLKAAQAANANGNSAGVATALAAFNEALAALQTYESAKGIKQ